MTRGLACIVALLLACGWTPRASAQTLKEAALSGNLKRIQQLVGKQPGVLKSKDGAGVLCVACYAGHRPVVTYLLAHGSKVTERDFDGSTPLHSAAAGDQEAIARLLLSRGASAKTPRYNGWTPLHDAAASGSLGVARLLLAAKSPVNAPAGPKKTTPYGVAKKYGNEAVAKLLKAKGGK